MLGPSQKNCLRSAKGEENDQLDTGDFQKGFVFGNISFDLKIEHDKAVHRNRDSSAIEGEDPYVGESW